MAEKPTTDALQTKKSGKKYDYNFMMELTNVDFCRS